MEPDIDLIFLANLENQIFLGIFFVNNPDSTNPKENQTWDLPTLCECKLPIALRGDKYGGRGYVVRGYFGHILKKI